MTLAAQMLEDHRRAFVGSVDSADIADHCANETSTNSTPVRVEIDFAAIWCEAADRDALVQKEEWIRRAVSAGRKAKLLSDCALPVPA